MKSKKSTLTKYSVLLLYPDYVSDSFGSDTFYHWGTGSNPDDAIAKARKRCMKHCSVIEEPTDLQVLLVTAGYNYGVPHNG